MPAARRRFLLVTNPIAGRAGRRLLEPVLALLREAGAHIEPCPAGIEGVRDAVSAAARSTGIDAVIAAGGDGTFRTAAAQMLGTRLAVGLVPLGTGNVLAHELGIANAPARIADMLLYGETRPMRAARANGAPFFLMAGVGFDGAVIGALDHGWKHRLGKVAYVSPTLRALAAPLPELEITIDGKCDEASWIVVANARCYGGGFVLVPHTHALDEGLHAVLFRSRDKLVLARQLIDLARGRLMARADVRMLGCSRVSVRAVPPAAVQIDGDAAGATPLDVEASDNSVEVILPFILPRSA